jgi:hypothetical protein
MASDTCMDDDGSLVACAACSGDVSMDRFGCDSLTKLCRCHTFPVGRTQCAAHQECLLPDTECGFVDAYLQPSFGNVPCGRCSTKPLCLVSGSGLGQCACLLTSVAVQTCVDKAQRVMPDPTALCLLSLGLGASGSGSYTANWADLASVPCALLNGAQAWCMTIGMGGATYSQLVVGLALQGGRRLLGVPLLAPNASVWRAAHEPCRSLMLAEAPLTILEAHVAAECERWRLVGERVVLVYNATVDPVLFTSYLGMAEAFANVTPSAYLFLFLHADWAQPLLVLGRRYWHRVLPVLNATRSIILRLHTMPRPQAVVNQVESLLPWFAARPPAANGSRVVVNWTEVNGGGHTASRPNASRPNASHPNAPHPHRPSSRPGPRATVSNATLRRLKGWKENLAAVKDSSVQIANGNLANLDIGLAGVWNKGPFTWPPDYSYWEKKQPCLAGSLLWEMVYGTMRSTVKYYTKTGPPRPPVGRTFREALPNLQSTAKKVVAKTTGVVGWFRSVIENGLGVDFGAIKAYASSPDRSVTPSPLSQDLTNFISCDFDKVQHCTGQRRSLWWGSILVTIGMVFVSIVCRALGLPYADTILIWMYVPVTLLFVFNYSVMCFPLVPTCFVEEVVDIVTSIMPASVSWPTQLLRWPGCVEGALPLLASGAVDYGMLGAYRPATADCFRPCGEWPFDFQSWEDDAAWLACDLGWCGTDFITGTYQPVVDATQLPTFLAAYVRLDRYVAAANAKRVYLQWDEMRSAQRVCFAFTAVNIIPVVVAVLVLAVAVLAAAAVLVALAQALVASLVALLIFTHTGG